MATVLQFIRNKSDFDDEATRLMGEAFDAACKGLRDTGQPIVVQEVIAKRIIKAAMKGERDPARQAVNPSLLLRAMQTAIAQGLRARNEPPEELPPELAVLLERLKEQPQQ